jgi:hypothetical protein
VAVIVLGDVVSVQSLPKDEFATSKFGHDQSFLNALGIIRASGVPGSILTVPGVAKWTRAILVRDAYFPNLAARYTFDPTHLIDEETAYFALTSRYTADTGSVGISARGTNLSDENLTFQYQGAYYGVFTPVIGFPIQTLNVTVVPVGAPLTDAAVENVTSGATVTLTPQGEGSYALSYTGAGFVATVTALAVEGTTSATLLLSVAADPGFRLLGIGGNLTSPSPGAGRFVAGSGSGSIDVTPSKFGSVLQSTIQVSPASALGRVVSLNHVSAPAHAPFALVSPSGVAVMTVGFEFSTPGAANLVSGLPPLVTTDATLANWTVRFVLYTDSAAGEGQLAALLYGEVQYLESEYGAKVLGSSGPWTVILLPPSSALPTGPRPVDSTGVPGSVVSPSEPGVEK